MSSSLRGARDSEKTGLPVSSGEPGPSMSRIVEAFALSRPARDGKSGDRGLGTGWARGLFDALSDGPAIEYAMSDATIVATPPIRNGDPKNGPKSHGKIWEEFMSRDADAEEHYGSRNYLLGIESRAAPVDIVTIEREDVTEVGLVPVGEESQSSSDAYIEAVLSRPSNWAGELHEAPIGILIALVEEAVRIEGPVHSDEVVSRLRHFADDKRKLLELLEPVSHAVERLDWLKEIAPGRTARAAVQKRYGGSCKACFR